MIALIGAGYTLQRFIEVHPQYQYHETHRSNLEAFDDHIKGDLSFLENSQALIFSLPPSQAALHLVDQLQFTKPAILLSSIGVYAKKSGKTQETDELGTSDRSQLIQAIENKFLTMPQAIVLRLGGLFDERRHPVHFIVKNNSVIEARDLINFVHIDDVVEAISQMITGQPRYRIYNVVDRNHPSKLDYYTGLTDKPIKFSQHSNLQFQVDSSRIINEFSPHPDFLNRIQ